MNRWTIVLCGAIVASGCGDNPALQSPTAPVAAPVVTAVVSGLVYESGGVPVAGASVESSASEKTTTAADGRYSLAVKSGQKTLTISKDGYYAGVAVLFVDRDVSVDIKLEPERWITPGQVISETVEPDDPICAVNWDARSPCRVFLITFPEDGLLDATMTWSGFSADLIDLVFDGLPADLVAPGERRFVRTVKAGVKYEIRVHTYPYFVLVPPRFEFELKVEFHAR